MTYNTNLQVARNHRDDEFYTSYDTIEKGLKPYEPEFKNANVYCNCDNPKTSQFTKYFTANMKRLGIHKLETTNYAPTSIQPTLYDEPTQNKTLETAYHLTITNPHDGKTDPMALADYPPNSCKKINSGGATTVRTTAGASCVAATWCAPTRPSVSFTTTSSS